MNWYISKLVFQIICGDGNHTAQFDEQLRLVHAEDEFHALNKARIIGDNECADIEMLRRVQWKFIDVSELIPVNNFTDGAEIYSKIVEEEHAAMYIQNTKKRAANLFQEGLHKFTAIN
jgi:hypothetical protein